MSVPEESAIKALGTATEETLRNIKTDGISSKDDYLDLVPHTDITATGALNFGLANIAMVVIRFNGAAGRVAGEGQTATANFGAYCPDDEPCYFPVINANLHLWVPENTVAYVFGLTRA